MIPQMIFAVVLSLSVNAIYGQRLYDRLYGNLTLENRNFQDPQWDSSTNPYQFLQELYENHGLTFHSVIDDCMFSDNSGLLQDVADAFSVPTWALKGVNSIGDVLTHVLAIHYGYSNSEETDYLKIEFSSHPMDFRNYNERYPQSPYHEIAMEKMYATRIAQLWELAKWTDQKNSYESCLQTYEYFSQKYCKELVGEDNESDCQLHYFRHEGYDHIALCLIAKQAKERLEELRTQAQTQEAAWRKTCDSNSYSAYEAYHKQYLGSVSADSALIRMKTFEETDYQKALQANTRVAYEGFLQKYPNGYYAARVAKNIVDLFQVVHHAEPDQMSFVAAYKGSRSRYAHVGIVNADKHGRTYTLTICGTAGFRTKLRPGETIWVELPVAEDYAALVESDNGEYRFATLDFNAYGYVLYLYGDLPIWRSFSPLFDNSIDSGANRQIVKKLYQEAESKCGKKISFDLE